MASNIELGLGTKQSLIGFPSGEVDQQCRERFLREAPEGWAALERQLRGYQVEVVFHQAWEIGSKVHDEKYEWTVCVPSDIDQMLILEKPSLVVTGTNEKYAFRLRRASNDRPYMVNRIIPALSGSEQQLLGSLLYYREFLSYFHSIWWVSCQYILENMGDKGFKIVTARFAEDRAGGQVAQIAFLYNGEFRASPHCEPGATYWAEFSPARNWAVLRSGMGSLGEGDSRVRVRVTSSYQEWFGGSCFPKDIVLEYENLKSHRITEVRKTLFGRPTPMERIADEFYLPHYGISEAVLQSFQDSGASWRITLNIVAVLVLVVAILLNRYIQRRAKAV